MNPPSISYENSEFELQLDCINHGLIEASPMYLLAYSRQIKTTSMMIQIKLMRISFIITLGSYDVSSLAF